jgi:hypothetical protein
LVGFYIKFVKAKAIFTVPWSAKSPFSLYTTIFVFPAGEAKLGYLWLNFISNAYDSTVSYFNCLFSERKG